MPTTSDALNFRSVVAGAIMGVTILIMGLTILIFDTVIYGFQLHHKIFIGLVIAIPLIICVYINLFPREQRNKMKNET